MIVFIKENSYIFLIKNNLTKFISIVKIYIGEIMIRKSNRFLVTIVMVLFLAVSLYSVTRSIYIWDVAGSGARFPDPDSPTDTIRPHEAWGRALDSIIADAGSLYAIDDDIEWVWGTDFPLDLNPYHLIIMCTGWQGTGAPILRPDTLSRLMDHLDRTGRTPGSQTALIIEGNDFAFLYADTSSGHYTYRDPFSDYVGALLLDNDEGPPGVLSGENGSLAEGMAFNYALSTGPTTSMDDIIINPDGPYVSHAHYLFNASRKCPARGMQRRSYSPGSVVLLPFQFGNIPRGGANTREQLLARILDFCVMPIPEILTTYDSDTLIPGDLHSIEYQVYDNRCVTVAEIEYSHDAGSTWIIMDSIAYPEDSTSYEFTVPTTEGDTCFIRVTAYDSVYNAVADTSLQFTIYDPEGIDDEVDLPEENNIIASPNPFNSTVSLEVRSTTEDILNIYTIRGRCLATIDIKSGFNSVLWNAKDENNRELPAGIYFAKLRKSGAINRLVLLK